MTSPLPSPRNSHEAQAPLLSPFVIQEDIDLGHDIGNEDSTGMTGTQAFNLYISHFLSTWNARTYEFAAIIFTASAYPDTLAASAIRGMFTTVAMICLSSMMGRWIDNAPNRMKNLVTTITANRLSVMVACVFWAFIVSDRSGSPVPAASQEPNLPSTVRGPYANGRMKDVIFCAILVLGVFEKLSGNANTMAMERDWIVVVAAPEGEPYDLTRLNSVMRRIDLICKLTAPIIISVIISAVGSTRVGVFVVGGTSAVSWGVEWWCARRVYRQNANLRKAKVCSSSEDSSDTQDAQSSPQSLQSRRKTALKTLTSSFLLSVRDFKLYFSSRVWIPSLALSLLHISALSYSATFITYLLDVGFSLNLITVARAAGSVVEISSTVVTPFGVDYLGKAHHHNLDYDSDDEDETDHSHVQYPSVRGAGTETGLERLGLWGVTWQLVNLIPVVFALWALSPQLPGQQTLMPKVFQPYAPPRSLTLSALTIFTFLSISRLGLWIFDLTTQQLTQTLVDPGKRSSFAGVETSFINAFELCHHISAVALSRPDQFRYLAAGSLVAVMVSAAAYAGWVWRQRGHLVHWERAAKACECIKGGSRRAV